MDGGTGVQRMKMGMQNLFELVGGVVGLYTNGD